MKAVLFFLLLVTVTGSSIAQTRPVDTIFEWWCDCGPRPGTEKEYDRSDLVIRGKVIGIDTIYGSNTLISDRRGVRLKHGKHKCTLEIQKLARLQMVIRRTFKSPVNVGDTIYVLALAGCGPANFSICFPGALSEQYCDFIVYADKWIENKIATMKKGERYVKRIEQTLIPNTFVTDQCRSSDRTTDAELAILAKCLE